MFLKMESEQEVSTAINFYPSLILLLRDFNFRNKKKEVSQLKYFDDFLFDEITDLKATGNQKNVIKILNIEQFYNPILPLFAR